MKKVVLLVLFCVIYFNSCNYKNRNENFEFPKTTWDMNKLEVLEAYDQNINDINKTTDKDYLILENQKIFGEVSSEVRFYFVDLGGDNSILCRAEVIYPENVNMDKVLKSMKKTYGMNVPKLNIFGYFLIIDRIFNEFPCVESDSLKLWASPTLNDKISTERQEEFRNIWSKYQKPILEDENWEYFLSEAHLVSIAWTNNNEIPTINRKDDKSNKLYFEGINSVIYNNILDNLSK